MYIIFSLVFLLSFFTGIFIVMSDDREKGIVKQESKVNIQSEKPYAIIDNEII